jgi:hypothetical protein
LLDLCFLYIGLTLAKIQPKDLCFLYIRLALAKIQPKVNGILKCFGIQYKYIFIYAVSHSHLMRPAIREAVATHGHSTSFFKN